MLLTDVHRGFQLSSALRALLKAAHELLRQEITLTGMDVALSPVKLGLTPRGGRAARGGLETRNGKGSPCFYRKFAAASAPEWFPFLCFKKIPPKDSPWRCFHLFIYFDFPFDSEMKGSGLPIDGIPPGHGFGVLGAAQPQALLFLALPEQQIPHQSRATILLASLMDAFTRDPWN